jgi:hypothetical protein
MSGNAPDSQAQGLEQTMSTVFACRSVVKYNMSLSAEQKDELIAEIDSSLQFLRESLITHASDQAPRPQFQQALAPVPLPDVAQPEAQRDERSTLQELYRIYHAYIDTQQSNNIGTFVVRFDAVIGALNEIQHHIERSRGLQEPCGEDLLHRVRAFIADLYYMFMELVRTLSNALEGSDVHIDTEEHSSMQDMHITRSTQEEQAVSSLQRLTPLMNVFTEHQLLNETRDALSSRISDTTAFLIYLEENLAGDVPKRDEVVSHLYKVSILLGDLAYLVSGYEDAVSLVLDR